jgi:hypothetical protein
MKKELLTGFVFLFCLGAVKAQNAAFNAGDWEIEDSTVQRLTGNFTACQASGTCVPYQKFNQNKAIKRQIRVANDISWLNFRKKWIRAQYDASDEARYCRLRSLPAGDAACRVAGYTTKILRYKTKERRTAANGLTDAPEPYYALPYRYYDTGRICPPPGDCF